MDIDGLWAIHDRDGQDLTERIAPVLISLKVNDRAGNKSDEITLSLKDDPPVELPIFSKALTIYMRRGVGMVRIGSYFASSINPAGNPDTIEITARSVHFGGPESEGGEAPALADEARTNVYEATTLGQIAKDAAGRLGVSDAVDPTAASHPIDYAEQEGESDISLISRLAKEAGVMAKLTGDTLAVGSPHAIASYVSGESLNEVTVLPSDVGAWTAEWDIRRNPGIVTARWHDATTAQGGVVEVGNGQPPRQLRKTFASESEATRAALAKIEIKKRGSKTIDLPLSAIDLRLWVGTPVRLPSPEWRDGVSGNWSVIEAEHLISESGASTRVQCQERK